MNLKNKRKTEFNESLKEYKEMFQSFDNVAIGRLNSSSNINIDEEKAKLNRSQEVVRDKK